MLVDKEMINVHKLKQQIESIEIVSPEEVRVIDGDTIVINENISNNVNVKKERIRLACLNCPERLSQSGIESTKRTQDFIDSSVMIFIIRYKKKDLYGRTIATVLGVNNNDKISDLNALLLSYGAAEYKSYNRSYCKIYKSQ